MIENVSNELKKYFEGKPILPTLLAFDMYILLGVSLLRFLAIFIHFWSIISALFNYVLILGILLCLAKKNYFALTIGLGVEALMDLISLIRYLPGEYGFFSWSSFYGLLIYGFFAYMALKKYSAKSST